MQLFDDYAARFARGERPEPRAYLARAGAGADELAQLIDGYLARASPPPPSEETVALTAAALRGRSPLVEARTRRGLSRDEVVDALIAALGLDRAKRAKVSRYYAELEAGVREPRRVDRRVLEALAQTLHGGLPELVWGLPVHGKAFRFSAAPAPPQVAAAKVAPEPPQDDVDRLFGEA